MPFIPTDAVGWAIVLLFSGLVSAVVGVSVPWIRDAITEKKRMKREARYAAIRIAVELERYSQDCWALIQRMDGETERAVTPVNPSLPDLPNFPPDIEWKALKQDLAAEVLSFSNGVRRASHAAEYSRAFESNPYDYEVQANVLGADAYRIAMHVREKYQLQPEVFFQEEADQMAEQREKYYKWKFANEPERPLDYLK